VKRFLKLLAGGYVALLIMLMLFETKMLFPTPPLEHGDWHAEHHQATEVWIESPDGIKISTWCWKHPQPRATIVFSHGNGEALAYLAEDMLRLRDLLRVNVVAYDYHGYGNTKGSPNEKNVLADAVAVGKWVEQNEPWNQVPMIPMGRSLGGAASIEIALQCKTDGLILDRTFSSTVDVAAYHFPLIPVRWLMRNRFPSEKKIAGYQGPLIQQHGTIDEVVPYQFGKQLFDACPSQDKELLTAPRLRHNDLCPREFYTKLDSFIKRVVDPTRAQ
jgi:uncharacterized protein